MKPTFGEFQENDGVVLQCPSCGGNFLHHERVEVFEREEDQDSGMHVLVADKKASFDTSLDGNPSKRRNGITIQFWCEQCSAKPTHTIAQHKGNTLFGFKNI
jgi:hypothetical protein